jgi:hypothetical protein
LKNCYRAHPEKGYYIDRIGKKNGNGKKKYDHFFVDGNLLVITLGLASENQSESILNFIDDNNLNEIPVVTCHPKLPKTMELFRTCYFRACDY